MNVPAVLLGLSLAVAFAFAVRHVLRHGSCGECSGCKGGGGCSGNCSCCSHAAKKP